MFLQHANPSISVSTLSERVVTVTLVVLLHVAAVMFWLMQPEKPAIVLNEMSVSVAIQQAEIVRPQTLPEPIPEPAKLRPKIESRVTQSHKQFVQAVAEATPLPVDTPVLVAPTVAVEAVVSAAPEADSEPDYQARYLNNRRPDYPMVARRMGWQGKVILNVEVLAEGACGGLSVFRSSGHEVLDNAAMNAVKTWRFTPARHAGHAVSLWFKVPINFSLEDNEA